MSTRQRGHHVATITHEGRIWDVYLELEDDPRHRETVRGCLAFSPADAAGGEEGVRTAPIIIEPDVDQAAAKARAFEDRDLIALLRSCLP